jgi:hypothetical protein
MRGVLPHLMGASPMPSSQPMCEYYTLTGSDRLATSTVAASARSKVRLALFYRRLLLSGEVRAAVAALYSRCLYRLGTERTHFLIRGPVVLHRRSRGLLMRVYSLKHR